MKIPSIVNNDLDQVVHDINNKNLCFEFHPVTNEYVYKQLKTLSDNKATGTDDIPSRLLKLAGMSIVDPITYIINLSISTGVFPDRWKHARLCPIFKW